MSYKLSSQFNRQDVEWNGVHIVLAVESSSDTFKQTLLAEKSDEPLITQVHNPSITVPDPDPVRQ